MAEWTPNDCWTFWGGWVQGWDTGFDNNGGSAFLGGFSYAASDNLTITNTTIFGDFGFEDQGGSDDNGFMNSLVIDWVINDCWEYVMQFDYLNNDQQFGGVGNGQDTSWAINQYLFYTISDCWKMGSRFEYYDDDRVGGAVKSLTLGANYRPCANLVIRPEVRWDDYATSSAPEDTTLFGVDMVFTF